jgi:hypothetical protein
MRYLFMLVQNFNFRTLSVSISLAFLFGSNADSYAQDSLKLATNLAYLTSVPSLIPIADGGQNEIIIYGEGRQNSNCLPLGQLSKVLSGAVFEKKDKDIIKNFPGRRLYEHELNTGFQYKHLFKKNEVTLHIGYKYRNMLYADITKDALNLVLYGNKMYEDKTANLSKMKFENLTYNQVSLGIGKKEQNLYASIMLSFLVGDNNQQLKTQSGGLYTAPYGEYLDLNYNFRYNQSYVGQPGFFKPKGYGFSTDVHFEYEFNKGTLLFDIQDLGIITWGNQSFNYIKDTAFRFEGIIDIQNIIKVNEYKFSFNGDSVIQNLASSKTNYRYNTTLPASFQVTYSFFEKIKNTPIQINCGLQARLLSHYYVMAYAKANFYLPKKFVTSVMLSGGGYSLFNVGWDVGYQGKHFQALIGCHNLVGLAAFYNYPSTSVSLRAGYRF